MPVGRDEMETLAGELLGSDSWTFVAKAGIGVDTLAEIFEAGARQHLRMLERGDDPFDALVDVVGQSFRLGWETRDKYGSA